MNSTRTGRISGLVENISNTPQQDKFEKWLEKEKDLIDIHVSMNPNTKCTLEEAYAELNAVNEEITNGSTRKVIGECFKCNSFILEDEEHTCKELV